MPIVLRRSAPTKHFFYFLSLLFIEEKEKRKQKKIQNGSRADREAVLLHFFYFLQVCGSSSFLCEACAATCCIDVGRRAITLKGIHRLEMARLIKRAT